MRSMLAAQLIEEILPPQFHLKFKAKYS